MIGCIPSIENLSNVAENNIEILNEDIGSLKLLNCTAWQQFHAVSPRKLNKETNNYEKDSDREHSRLINQIDIADSNIANVIIIKAL